MYNPKILAQNIRKYRTQNNLTQAELATKLFVTPQCVSKWECGTATPDIETLYNMCEIFDVSASAILGDVQSGASESVMIGIDGGGTKTEFVLFTPSGHIVKRVVLDGCNPNSHGFEATFRVLRTGIDLLLAVRPDILGVFAGISGCMSGTARDTIYGFFKKQYKSMNVSINSDMINVVRSVDSHKKFIAAICGTGSVVYASDGNDMYRIGGWGYFFDDVCSGYALGRDAIRAVLAIEDGFGEETIIKDLLYRELGSTVWEQVSDIYQKGKEYIASFSHIVFEAYRKGDAVAHKIVEENVRDIATRIMAAKQKYDCGSTAIVAGGITKQKDILLPFLEKETKGEVTILFPDMSPIYGACIEGCNLYSTPGKDFKKNFSEDYIKEI